MLWLHAASLLPKSDAATFNSALLDLGALICVARKPKCAVCPVKAFCCAKDPAALPVRKSRPKTRQLIERHVLIVRRRRILLQQSPDRWRGMWILPPFEPDDLEQRDFQRQPVYEAVFPFTNHRITLCVYRRPAPNHRITLCVHRRRAPKRIGPGQQWFGSIEQVPMPSPHRRAAQSLIQTFVER